MSRKKQASVAIPSRRRHRRYTTTGDAVVSVEFPLPCPDGPRCAFRLTDLSAAGISFLGEAALPGIDVGETIPEVEVVLGDCRIHGELVVLHVTPRSDTMSVYGALFYPATERDLTALKGAMAGIEAVHRD